MSIPLELLQPTNPTPKPFGQGTNLADRAYSANAGADSDFKTTLTTEQNRSQQPAIKPAKSDEPVRDQPVETADTVREDAQKEPESSDEVESDAKAPDNDPEFRDQTEASDQSSDDESTPVDGAAPVVAAAVIKSDRSQQPSIAVTADPDTAAATRTGDRSVASPTANSDLYQKQSGQDTSGHSAHSPEQSPEIKAKPSAASTVFSPEPVATTNSSTSNSPASVESANPMTGRSLEVSGSNGRLSASAQAVPTPATPTSETPEGQVVRGMMAMVRSGGGRLTMRLEPETLGALRVQVNVSKGQVQAQFHASTLQAREMIQQHVESLRSALENQGLKLDRVHIQPLNAMSEGESTRQGSAQHERRESEGRNDAGRDQNRGQRENQRDPEQGRDQRSARPWNRSFSQAFESSQQHEPARA